MTILRNVRLTSLDTPSTGELVDIEFTDTITAIRPTTDTSSPEAGSVDGGGRFLLPGLIDSHVHLGTREALVVAAHSGISTVVDLGTHPDSLVDDLRTATGVPAILSAGSAASAPGSSQIARMGFPPGSGVTDAADAERYLDWRVEHGSDVIKIIIEDPAATPVPALDVVTISALVAGAHGRGLLTVAHVVTAAAFDRGLDACVDILTHAPLDKPLSERTLERMLEQKTIVAPTLVMMNVMARARLGEHAEGAFGNALESVRGMHGAGIPIIAGTDANETPIAPVPHGPSLHDEIAYLQQAGLSAAEALRAATSGAADAFRLGDRGRIAVGQRADLVLVDGDPLIDATVVRQPYAVWVTGIPAA